LAFEALDLQTKQRWWFLPVSQKDLCIQKSSSPVPKTGRDDPLGIQKTFSLSQKRPWASKKTFSLSQKRPWASKKHYPNLKNNPGHPKKQIPVSTTTMGIQEGSPISQKT